MNKSKAVKLNKLQSRTLALFQALARHPGSGIHNPATGEVTISQVPHPHGNHVHIGDFVVPGRDASGFANQAVWTALERKGLAISNFPLSIILTPAGLAFDTGYGEALQRSDH